MDTQVKGNQAEFHAFYFEKEGKENSQQAVKIPPKFKKNIKEADTGSKEKEKQ
jgi:hypothetical protein